MGGSFGSSSVCVMSSGFFFFFAKAMVRKSTATSATRRYCMDGSAILSGWPVHDALAEHTQSKLDAIVGLRNGDPAQPQPAIGRAALSATRTILAAPRGNGRAAYWRSAAAN